MAGYPVGGLSYMSAAPPEIVGGEPGRIARRVGYQALNVGGPSVGVSFWMDKPPLMGGWPPGRIAFGWMWAESR